MRTTMPPCSIIAVGTLSREALRFSRAALFGLLPRIVREAALIVLCAALPATALYDYRNLTLHPNASTVPISGNVLWIDARSEVEFFREHIPGALCLNEKNWEDALPRLFETWQPPRPIVVYCSAGCPASAKIAEKLTELGLEPVRILEGGFEEWKHSKG